MLSKWGFLCPGFALNAALAGALDSPVTCQHNRATRPMPFVVSPSFSLRTNGPGCICGTIHSGSRPGK